MLTAMGILDENAFNGLLDGQIDTFQIDPSHNCKDTNRENASLK